MSRRRYLLACAAVAALAGCGGEGDDDAPAAAVPTEFPAGGAVPQPKITNLDKAAKAAGCELRSVRIAGREHVSGPVIYTTVPPSGGDHAPAPAQDGAYPQAPPTETVVHSLEHGRVVVWFDQDLAERARADLKALHDQDPLQLLLVPDTTDMDAQVAATAWNREPAPNGTGHVLTCAKLDAAAFDALQAFRDRHRGRGPEAIP